MGRTLTYDLYVDDSGTRSLNIDAGQDAGNAQDYFALGGVLVPSEAAGQVVDAVRVLKAECHIDGHLRSHDIRRKKRKFAWIDREPERAKKLYEGINQLVAAMPGWATAVVIDRPGYDARYRENHSQNRWELSKSAYDILIERSVKIADADGRRLKVYVESSGKREDRLIQTYHASLRNIGLQFAPPTSGKYRPLSARDFERVTMKNPNFVKKGNPLTDLADLILFPLAMAKYRPTYRPYLHLRECGKIIDCRLGDGLPDCGVKYYCFDDPRFWGG